MDSKSNAKAEGPLKKIYFNMYIAGVIRNRPDFEAINCDLLYFCLLMKMNQYAKEVYFLRKSTVKAANNDAESVYKHLVILRDFALQFYEIAPPRAALIQNELTDSLEELDKLEVHEDPFGEKKHLGDLSASADDVASSLSQMSLSGLDDADLDPGEASPRRPVLERTPSVVAHP